MATEIEYKFLINDVNKIAHLAPFKAEGIKQGYITTDPTTVVRVSISEYNDLKGHEWTEAWVCVKGPSSGLSRKEFEWRVPLADGLEMMKLCGSRVIEKDRFFFTHTGGHVIELDVFSGKLGGLVMAEIEVDSETTSITFPEWFGKDVSHDRAFANSSLALLSPEESIKMVSSIR